MTDNDARRATIELYWCLRECDPTQLAEIVATAKMWAVDEDVSSDVVRRVPVALARAARAETVRQENVIEFAALDIDDSAGELVDGDFDVAAASAELLGHVMTEVERRQGDDDGDGVDSAA